MKKASAVSLVLASVLALGTSRCCGDLLQIGGCACDVSGGRCGSNAARLFEATLSGDQVVPPVSTSASGSATLRLNATETALSYTIGVSGVSSAESAKLYTGTSLENGTARITLCAPCTTNSAGVLATGTDTVTAAIITALRAFGAYIEIRTAAGPVLRGQLRVSAE
jgi:hypothetical protein